MTTAKARIAELEAEVKRLEAAMGHSGLDVYIKFEGGPYARERLGQMITEFGQPETLVFSWPSQKFSVTVSRGAIEGVLLDTPEKIRALWRLSVQMLGNALIVCAPPRSKLDDWLSP